MLREKGKTEHDIEKMFSNDPFVKTKTILKQVRALEHAKQKNDAVLIEKAINKFTDGELYPESQNIPTTKQEWVDYLDKLAKDLKELRKEEQKKKTKKQQKP